MIRGRGAFVVAPLLVFALALGRPALAADPAAAQALFNEGRKLMAERNYAAACPKLEESQRLDAGIGTQFNLADCYEHIGRTASAWAQFLEVAAAAKSSGQRARESNARVRAAQLEPRLSRLVVVVDASRAPPGLVVKRDDVDVGVGQWGTPVPIDPGPHVIAASAPGKVRWETRVVVGERADRATATVPALEDAPPEAPPVVAQPPSPETAAPQRPSARPHEAQTTVLNADLHPGRTQRVLGFVAGGIGLVGVGIGAGYGLLSKSKHDQANSGHCDARGFCDATGITLRDDAIRAGTASTVAFVAGGVALAIGILLLVTAPSDPAAGTAVMRAWGPTAGGMQVW